MTTLEALGTRGWDKGLDALVLANNYTEMVKLRVKCDLIMVKMVKLESVLTSTSDFPC